MANITINRLNTTIKASDLDAIDDALQVINTSLPEGSLTDQERIAYSAIEVANKIFTEDCVTELGINGAAIMPAYINVPNLINDFTLFEQLDTIKSGVMQVLRRVEDLQRIAGKESYDTATQVYRHYATASDAGIAGAKESYDKLKMRYKTSGRQPDTELMQ